MEEGDDEYSHQITLPFEMRKNYDFFFERVDSDFDGGRDGSAALWRLAGGDMTNFDEFYQSSGLSTPQRSFATFATNPNAASQRCARCDVSGIPHEDIIRHAIRGWLFRGFRVNLKR